MADGRRTGCGGGGRWEEEMGFLLWVGVVVGAGKGGMGRGKEAMIKGGCNFLESGVRVLL